MDWDINGQSNMTLSGKITQYFTLIVFTSLCFGFFIFYFAIERATMQSAIGKLENLNHVIEQKLACTSIEIIQQQHPHVKVIRLTEKDMDLVDEVIREGNYEWNEMLQTMVNHVTVTTYPFIGDQHYSIQSQISLTIIDDDYFVGIAMTIAWILVFIIITIIFFGELITRKLYTPFFHLLDKMNSFDVREKKSLELIETPIKEFSQLNKLFYKTSEQSIQHYQALKEFTENLSHELQTPIANIKGKLELMLNSDLSEQQMIALSSMYDELDKVSSINQSLVLLMSLDHHQVSNESINISDLLNEIISNYEDIIFMNGLELNLDIMPDIFINLNPLLAHVVLSNLVSNACRHNVKNGYISITLNSCFLNISNSGNEQEFSNDTIFQRFNKGKYNPNSIGIGLALVKKILTVYNLDISYNFHQKSHSFLINFNKLHV